MIMKGIIKTNPRPHWESDLSGAIAFKKQDSLALNGIIAPLFGYRSEKRYVTSSIPGQGACLGCGFSLSWGPYDRQLIDVSHIGISLPLFLPPFPFP